MRAKRMRTIRQQLIEEPASLADRTANGAGADTEPARSLALEEILREVDEIERKVWAWSGSAFLNKELEGAEDADCKTELYSELCRIGNAMHWLRTKICALSSPDHADAGKVEGDGWLPIESAPKDGAPVLAYQAGRYFKCWLECDRYEGGYFWQDEEDSEPSPTHWRPLPSAPSGGDRHGE